MKQHTNTHWHTHLHAHTHPETPYFTGKITLKSLSVTTTVCQCAASPKISGHTDITGVWLRRLVIHIFILTSCPHLKPPGCTPTTVAKERAVANRITHQEQCSSPPGIPLWQFDWQVEHPPIYLWEPSPGPRGCQGRCPDGLQGCSSGCCGRLCGAAQIWWNDCKKHLGI